MKRMLHCALLAAFWLTGGGSLLCGAGGDPTGLEELPLPRWTEEDAGGVQKVSPVVSQLLPDGTAPEDGQKAGNGGTGDNLLFFIPKGSAMSKNSRAGGKPVDLPPLKQVSVEFVAASEKADAADYLIDPELNLPEVQAQNLRRLLTYHASESKLSAHFLVLGNRECLPASADPTRLAGGRLMAGNTCLVVYSMGEPWRIRLFMSRDVTQAVSAKYLGELINACVQDAIQVTDPLEQLQRFATRLSIRLIWLERAYPAVFAMQKEPMGTVAETATGKTKLKVNKEAPALPEVSPVPVMNAAPLTIEGEAPEPEAKGKALGMKWDRLAMLAGWGLGGLIVLLLLLVILLRWMRRRQRQVRWTLPETEITPRLGGPHCGGGGASANYG